MYWFILILDKLGGVALQANLTLRPTPEKRKELIPGKENIFQKFREGIVDLADI